MSEFDYQTERCSECDGHWRHYEPCSWLHPEQELCPYCGEWYEEGTGTLMNLGGVNFDNQPVYCPGCAGEASEYVEGFGVR